MPTSTANQRVAARIINVEATDTSIVANPFSTRRKVRDPSVTPSPPGSIVIAPTIVAKA